MRTYFVRVPYWAKMIYPKAIWKGSSNQINWTFDDGPHPNSTPRLLKVLEEIDVKATFFMSGKACLRFPHLLEMVRGAGHTVGSHGYDHLDGWRTSTQRYIEDVQNGGQIIGTNLYRPPYGRMTKSQYHKVSKFCDIMMWNVMPGDFDRNVSHNELSKRIEKIRLGDIVVLHDTPFSVKRSISILASDSVKKHSYR